MYGKRLEINTKHLLWTNISKTESILPIYFCSTKRVKLASYFYFQIKQTGLFNNSNFSSLCALMRGVSAAQQALPLAALILFLRSEWQACSLVVLYQDSWLFTHASSSSLFAIVFTFRTPLRLNETLAEIICGGPAFLFSLWAQCCALFPCQARIFSLRKCLLFCHVPKKFCLILSIQ